MNPPSPPVDALRLLESFDYRSLGDGDPVAGMNTLVAMCCVLSSVAGPDSGLFSSKEGLHLAGIHLLTAGSLTSEIVQARVLKPLAAMQNNLSANIRPHIAQREAGQTRHTAAGEKSVKHRTIEQMEAETVQNQLKDGGLNLRAIAETLLSAPRTGGDTNVLECPSFFLVGTNPVSLSRRLGCVHLNHPTVFISASSFGECIALQPVAQGIMEGCDPGSGLPIFVKGHVTARISREVLAQILLDDSSKVQWPTRTLWLTDDPGDTMSMTPDTLSPQGNDRPVKLDAIQMRYELALRKLLGERIKHATGKQIGTDAMLGTNQAHFVQYLRRRESSIPGITGALRNLPTTLRFGLVQIFSARPAPEGFQPSTGKIHLAMHLADRMVHTVRQNLDIERSARVEKIARSVLTKLVEGPHTERRLTTRHHRLPIQELRVVLGQLEDQGKTERIDGNWRLTERGIAEATPTPVIDVP